MVIFKKQCTCINLLVFDTNQNPIMFSFYNGLSIDSSKLQEHGFIYFPCLFPEWILFTANVTHLCLFIAMDLTLLTYFSM